jgi:hypothetical protein
MSLETGDGRLRAWRTHSKEALFDTKRVVFWVGRLSTRRRRNFNPHLHIKMGRYGLLKIFANTAQIASLVIITSQVFWVTGGRQACEGEPYATAFCHLILLCIGRFTQSGLETHASLYCFVTRFAIGHEPFVTSALQP